jgi:hypothetical protein
MSESNNDLHSNNTSHDENDSFHSREKDILRIEEQTQRSYHSDAMNNDRNIGTHQEGNEADKVRFDTPMETTFPPQSLSSEVMSDEQNYTIGSEIAAVRRSLAPIELVSSRPTNSLLNQHLSLDSVYSQVQSSDTNFVRPFQQGTTANKSEASDDDVTPIAETFSTKHLHHCYNVKSPAPSSVKSYGSNLGSEDCGGSLDVEEAHSDDARSLDEAFPVSMPDHDPATAAVASLSIDHTESSNSFNQFPARYNDSHGHIMPLTLQRFHQNSVNQVDRKANSQLTLIDPGSRQLAAHSIYHTDTAADDKIYSHWNDPRMDKPSSSSHEARSTADMSLSSIKDQANARRRSRSRSRSRSPPV